MGLIYVQSEGPDGILSDRQRREGHPRDVQAHGHNDEETVALIAVAHLRKPRCRASHTKGPDPEGRRLEFRVSGGPASSAPVMRRRDRQRLEVTGRNAAQWSNHSSRTCSGSNGSWRNLPPAQTSGPKDVARSFPTRTIRKKRKPKMLTTDCRCASIPSTEISRRFLEDPQAFAEVRTRLVQADASRSRAAGALSRPGSAKGIDLAGSGAAVDHPLIDDADAAALKLRF